MNSNTDIQFCQSMRPKMQTLTSFRFALVLTAALVAVESARAQVPSLGAAARQEQLRRSPLILVMEDGVPKEGVVRRCYGPGGTDILAVSSATTSEQLLRGIQVVRTMRSSGGEKAAKKVAVRVQGGPTVAAVGLRDPRSAELKRAGKVL